MMNPVEFLNQFKKLTKESVKKAANDAEILMNQDVQEKFQSCNDDIKKLSNYFIENQEVVDSIVKTYLVEDEKTTLLTEQECEGDFKKDTTYVNSITDKFIYMIGSDISLDLNNTLERKSKNKEGLTKHDLIILKNAIWQQIEDRKVGYFIKVIFQKNFTDVSKAILY